eukprot:5034842-Prymnesium_polylepis.2
MDAFRAATEGELTVIPLCAAVAQIMLMAFFFFFIVWSTGARTHSRLECVGDAKTFLALRHVLVAGAFVFDGYSAGHTLQGDLRLLDYAIFCWTFAFGLLEAHTKFVMGKASNGWLDVLTFGVLNFGGMSSLRLSSVLKVKNLDMIVCTLLCIACVLRVVQIEGFDAKLWSQDRQEFVAQLGYGFDEFGYLQSAIGSGLRTVLALTAPLLCIRPLELLVINNERLGMVFASSAHMLNELANFGRIVIAASSQTAFPISPTHHICLLTAHNSQLNARRSAAWLPIWSLFGYFEPMLLEKSPDAVPVVPYIFLFMWMLIAVILVMNLLIAAFNDQWNECKTDFEAESAFSMAKETRLMLRAYPVPAPFNIAF